MDEMIRAIRNVELRPGVERIYLPGERGYEEMARRRVDGIPVAADLLEAAETWRKELGLS
jgi:LDH2 family malate/lactate/ureidoglycolate dehydrogenase